MENFKPAMKVDPTKVEERKKVEKVVSGVVKTKKKSGAKKFLTEFLADDVSNVAHQLKDEVVVPSIKNLIADAFNNGINLLMFGSTARRGTSNSRFDRVTFVDYSGRSNTNRQMIGSTRTGFNYDEFIFETRGDAEEVLSQLDAMLEKYGVVTVLDLYDSVGKTCDHTAGKYGWLSLRNAQVVRVNGGGYSIKLPKAAPID